MSNSTRIDQLPSDAENTGPLVLMTSAELEELIRQLASLANDIASQPHLFPPAYGWRSTMRAARCLRDICLRARREQHQFQFIQLEIKKLSRRKRAVVKATAGMCDWNLDVASVPTGAGQ